MKEENYYRAFIINRIEEVRQSVPSEDYLSVSKYSKEHNLEIDGLSLFDSELPKAIRIIENIKIFRKHAPNEKLPLILFHDIFYGAWGLFIAMRICINSCLPKDENIKYIEKQAIPIFNKFIDIGLSEFSKECIVTRDTCLQKYKKILSLLKENKIDDNYVNICHIVDVFNSVCPNYRQSYDQYVEDAIFKYLLSHNRNIARVYDQNLAYFQSFGISEFKFKNSFLFLLECVKEYIYDFTSFGNGKFTVLLERIDNSCYQCIIIICKVFESLCFSEYAENNFNVLVVILNRSFLQLKKLVLAEEQEAIKLLEYFKFDIQYKKNLILNAAWKD